MSSKNDRFKEFTVVSLKDNKVVLRNKDGIYEEHVLTDTEKEKKVADDDTSDSLVKDN